MLGCRKKGRPTNLSVLTPPKCMLFNLAVLGFPTDEQFTAGMRAWQGQNQATKHTITSRCVEVRLEEAIWTINVDFVELGSHCACGCDLIVIDQCVGDNGNEGRDVKSRGSKGDVVCGQD